MNIFSSIAYSIFGIMLAAKPMLPVNSEANYSTTPDLVNSNITAQLSSNISNISASLPALENNSIKCIIGQKIIDNMFKIKYLNMQDKKLIIKEMCPSIDLPADIINAYDFDNGIELTQLEDGYNQTENINSKPETDYPKENCKCNTFDKNVHDDNNVKYYVGCTINYHESDEYLTFDFVGDYQDNISKKSGIDSVDCAFEVSGFKNDDRAEYSVDCETKNKGSNKISNFKFESNYDKNILKDYGIDSLFCLLKISAPSEEK